MCKEIPFEVNCKDVVSTREVTVKNMVTGAEFKAPAVSWRWKNSFYAYVTFIFRGQEFTVLAEVHPEITF
jgi:hypothetical protein